MLREFCMREYFYRNVRTIRDPILLIFNIGNRQDGYGFFAKRRIKRISSLIRDAKALALNDEIGSDK